MKDKQLVDTFNENGSDVSVGYVGGFMDFYQLDEKRRNAGFTDYSSFFDSSEFKRRLGTLTTKERGIWSMIYSKHGVTLLKGKPGIAKTAIFRSIANKLGLCIIDVRMAQRDETDLQFPYLLNQEDTQLKVINFAPPAWAVRANKYPTLIVFEEFNRAQLSVRNSCLQILLEREIGDDFRFAPHVFMAATSNLGEEDNTDVDELDSATNNRFLHKKYTLEVEEWLNWGNGVIHPDILNYIKLNPTKIYADLKNEEEAFATNRTWHMLSDYIVTNFGGGYKPDDNGNPIKHKSGDPKWFIDGYEFDTKLNSFVKNDGKYIRNWGNVSNYIKALHDFAPTVIGNHSVHLIKFLESVMNISLMDVVDNYDKRSRDIMELTYDRKSALCTELLDLDISVLNEKQSSNIVKFIKIVDDEHRGSFLIRFVDKIITKYGAGAVSSNTAIKYILHNFKEEYSRMKEFNKINKE